MVPLLIAANERLPGGQQAAVDNGERG